MRDGVVRVGSTVRRPLSPSSPFAVQVSNTSKRPGLRARPFVGVDELGRDVFSSIDGVVHPKWQRWTDAQSEAAGRLLRGLHDATAGSSLADGHETVCHHDAGPNNFVVRDGLPVAMIDFDFAAPGARLDDLAYAGWGWCIASKRERAPAETQAAQLRLLVDV